MQDQLSNDFCGEMETAWNWLDNTEVSLDLFDFKVTNYALSVQNKAIAADQNSAGSTNKVLQPFTALQLENMALGEYGTTANKNPSTQYYIPQCIGGTVSGKVCTCTGGCTGAQGWQWEPRGTDKTNAAMKYADTVRDAPNPPCP